VFFITSSYPPDQACLDWPFGTTLFCGKKVIRYVGEKDGSLVDGLATINVSRFRVQHQHALFSWSAIFPCEQPALRGNEVARRMLSDAKTIIRVYGNQLT
jgi:hypothetical protein